MRVRPTLASMALLLALAVWALPGCRQQADEARTAEEQATDEPGAHEDLDDHDAEMPPEGIDAEQVATEAEETLSLEIDYERHYDSRDLERLRGVLWVGTPEQKARVQQILTDLMLNSRVVLVRRQAAGMLGSSPAGAEQALAEVARTDTEADVRQAAIDSLAKAPVSEELMATLTSLQEEADDAAVRSAAAKAEMELRLSDPDTWLTRDWVERQLAKREDDATAELQMQLVHLKKGLPILIEVLATSDNVVARQAAACSISLICAGTSPRQEEFAELALTIKKEGIPEPEPANLDGLKPLERALATDPAPEVRAMAAQGLGYLGQESSAPILGRALHDDNEEVRWWAALALVTVPSEAALDDIAHAATRDESDRVREAAVRALGWIDDDGVALPLVRATADTSSAVRQAAATELARVDHPAALQALTTLFDDENEDVRWAAVLAVGDMRDPEAAPALAQAMRDPSPMVANAAERALQRMGIAERRFGTRDEM